METENKIELMEGQFVEVDYDPELVRDFQTNGFGEIEGIGDGDDIDAIYKLQDAVNEDGLDELCADDTIVENVKEAK